jgi:hypothetical protein
MVEARKQSMSNRAVARAFGVDEKTIRKALRRAGWIEPEPVQGALDLAPLVAAGADPNLAAAGSIPAEVNAIPSADLPLAADPNVSAPGPAPPLGEQRCVTTAAAFRARQRRWRSRARHRPRSVRR